MCPGQLKLMNLSLCFVGKEAKGDLYYFLCDCSYFRKNFDSHWSNLDVKASNSCPTDGSQISAFIKNLDQDSKALLLLGCLLTPTLTVITPFIASAKSTSCALNDYVSLRLHVFYRYRNFLHF